MPTIHVNGRDLETDASDDTPVLCVLRDHLGMTGTKFGCGKGLCGACTIHLDGVATRSGTLPLNAVAGKKITTIEGVSPDRSHPVQKAWLELDVPQCGYCQSGRITPATALLAATPASEFRLVGKPLPRLDTPAKLDGSADFGIDVKRPGMLHAVLVQCPTLGGRAKGVDATEAEKRPGVRRVFTAASGGKVVWSREDDLTQDQVSAARAQPARGGLRCGRPAAGRADAPDRPVDHRAPVPGRRREDRGPVLARRRPPPGAPAHDGRRLRREGEPRDLRVAGHERDRLRPDRGALGRHHAAERRGVVAPAIAIHAATGRRVRALPFAKQKGIVV